MTRNCSRILKITLKSINCQNLLQNNCKNPLILKTKPKINKNKSKWRRRKRKRKKWKKKG
jgi:hypothetical protein